MKSLVIRIVTVSCVLIGQVNYLRSAIGGDKAMIQVIIFLQRQSDTTLHPVMIERCSSFGRYNGNFHGHGDPFNTE